MITEGSGRGSPRNCSGAGGGFDEEGEYHPAENDADMEAAAAKAEAAMATRQKARAARVEDLLLKLRKFSLELSDEKATSKINTALTWFKYDGTVDYYSKNPELADYTVTVELERMQYNVTPHYASGTDPSEVLTDPADIRQYFEEYFRHAAVAVDATDVGVHLSWLYLVLPFAI